MSKNNAKHIYSQLPQIAENDPRLSPYDKMVMIILFAVLKNKKYAYHRNSKLKLLCNFSERTVSRCLNKLESLGYIVREGMSFNRRFSLGKLFEMSSAIYAKVSLCKKNLVTAAKSFIASRRSSIHTKSLPNKNNNGLTQDEIQTINWYKMNPWANIRKDDLYLFG